MMMDGHIQVLDETSQHLPAKKKKNEKFVNN